VVEEEDIIQDLHIRLLGEDLVVVQEIIQPELTQVDLETIHQLLHHKEIREEMLIHHPQHLVVVEELEVLEEIPQDLQLEVRVVLVFRLLLLVQHLQQQVLVH
jgi:hypothetical protein